MFNINKIQFVVDAILYDGDQIAFLTDIDDPNCRDVELSMTVEDLINGEIPLSKRQEILINKQAIIQEIQRLGFTIL